MRRCGTRAKHAGRSAPSWPCCCGRWETFLYTLKAGPAGGRLRRPSSAGSDTTATGEPASPSHRASPFTSGRTRVELEQAVAPTYGSCPVIASLRAFGVVQRQAPVPAASIEKVIPPVSGGKPGSKIVTTSW
jgi:hypothetical protein